MKAHLMFRDRDFAPTKDLPFGADDLQRDLDLPRIYATMSGDDRFLYQVAQQGILDCLTDCDEIDYRQQVLADCLAAPGMARQFYALAVEAIDREHKVFLGFMSRSPATLLHRSIQVLETRWCAGAPSRTCSTARPRSRSPFPTGTRPVSAHCRNSATAS